MIHGILLRQPYPTHTYGILLLPTGDIFHTIEPPWLNNQQNMSCIPSGTYKVRFLPRSASGKYRKVWHILDVLGRQGVLIHNGNLVSHTKGCLIIGMKKGFLGQLPAVLQSRMALRKLLRAVGEDDFTLTIMGKFIPHEAGGTND